jgi:hypothetical protein
MPEEKRMSRSKLAKTAVAMAAAALAATAVAVPAGATKTIPSSLQIEAEGDHGRVKSHYASCRRGRHITLKQAGHGLPLTRGISDADGSWELDLEEARQNLQGGLPYRVYAVLRPKFQAPSGTCLGWVSRNFEISTETIEINVR